MNLINSLVIEGNIVRDPLYKETAKGNSLCTFSIASNRAYKSSEGNLEKEVSFFDVETWGNLAQSCTQNGSKGRGVRVVGRLKQNRWVGNDGKNYSKVSVIAEHVEFKPIFAKKDKDVAIDSVAEEVNQAEKELETEAMPAF